MKITLDINDIDYGALVEVFLPLVHDKLAEKKYVREYPLAGKRKK